MWVLILASYLFASDSASIVTSERREEVNPRPCRQTWLVPSHDFSIDTVILSRKERAESDFKGILTSNTMLTWCWFLDRRIQVDTLRTRRRWSLPVPTVRAWPWRRYMNDNIRCGYSSETCQTITVKIVHTVPPEIRLRIYEAAFSFQY